MTDEEFELLGEPRMTMAQFTLEEQLYGLEENDEALEVDMDKFTKGPWKVSNISGQAGFAVDQGELQTIAVHKEPDARLIAEAPELYAELDMIVDAWELIDVGKVPGRELTPWEKERLNFARDLLDQIDGN